MPAFKSFSGLRNDVTPERFADTDLAVATNVDLDNSGKLLSRGGYTKKINGTFHSMWSDGDFCLFVTGTELHRLNTGLTSSTVIRNDLTAGLEMSYAAVNGQVYYSNGSQSGIYSQSGNRTWGITPPVYQPLAQAAYGDMATGRYQFALTYVRNDGQESGTGIADLIDITTGAINFTDIPVSPDPSVTHKIIYLTPCNGDVLYRAATLENATTSLVYRGGQIFTPLETQFKQQVPQGKVAGYFSGYMYVSNGQWLYYSDPHGLELFNPLNYLGFAANITLFAPVQDGVFIGTNKGIHFMNGRDPSTSILVDRADYGAIPGTLVYIPASQVKGLEKAPDEVVPVWTSREGICCGISGGQLLNLTQEKWKMGAANSGAAVYRKITGNSQYITVLR